jgi:NADH-quinone oxidoreductase subunit C
VTESLKNLGAALAADLPGYVSHAVAFGELTVTAEAGTILDTLAALRDRADCRFINFIDIAGVDYPAREKRFDVVYHLLSPSLNQRVRIKIETDEMTPVSSATGVFPGALWFEREAYDMFGILFSGHPDLRRILTDYGFDGHPLRKDFPMTGFHFDFLSPWEGGRSAVPGDEKANGQ